MIGQVVVVSYFYLTTLACRYLLDWKERACLRQDELQVLFSNIEDVYHFNQYLLKHLSDSILNPVKIAKCFIDLKDGFEVYTRYW